MIKLKGLFHSNLFKFSTVLAFNQGLNFLLIFIYLKNIESSTYGMIGFIQSYAILIGVVSMFGIRDGFYTLYYKVNKINLYSNFFLFFLIILFVVTAVATLFESKFIDIFSIPKELYSLIFIYAMSNALYANLEIVMRLENWNTLYLYLALIRGVTVFILKLYLVLSLENSMDFIIDVLWIDIGSYLLISMIVFIAINIKVLKFKYHIDFTLYPRLFKVGMPFLASNASGWIFNGFDRILIERFFSLEILGIYLYGIKIAAALGTILHQILNLLYAPRALKLLSEDKRVEMESLGSKIKNFLGWLILSSLIVTILVYFSLNFFNIAEYEMISLFFLGAFLVEISKIVPRINGQKLLFLEKSYILSSLYIASSMMIVLVYYVLMEHLGIGIVFLSQIGAYFLVSLFIDYYIVHYSDYQIVKIKTFVWMLLFLISTLLLVYMDTTKEIIL